MSTVKNLMSKYPKCMLTIIGMVHGLSNLGGGLLAAFVSNLYDDKNRIRSHVAFGYLFFAAIQLSILALLVPEVMGWHQFIYAALGGAVFLITERCLFRSISTPLFERMFTILIGTYAVLIFLEYLGFLDADQWA